MSSTKHAGYQVPQLAVLLGGGAVASSSSFPAIPGKVSSLWGARMEDGGDILCIPTPLQSPVPTSNQISALICHTCGYDMHDGKVSDPCPECGTPFDTRPDGYTKPWKLTVPLVCSILTILVMPFISIFSFIFMIPSFLVASAKKTGIA